MKSRLSLVTLACLLACGGLALGQSNQNVSRAEYEKLKKELEALKAQMKEFKQTAPPSTKAVKEQAEMIQEQGDELDRLNKNLRQAKSMAESLKPGSTKHLLTGYGFVGYTDRQGGRGNFSAGLNPIFLWKHNDRLLFESELELGLEGNTTEVGLEYAQISYLLNDYVTLAGGRFLSPFGIFRERLHPAWINKLPDAPLAFRHHGGIAPLNSLGFQTRGGLPLGPTKLNYTLFVANGPRLNDGEDEMDEAGMLHFDNLEDLDDNKSVGGRLGFLPIPELEVGYSVQYASVSGGATTANRAEVWLHGSYLSFVRDCDLLKGTFDLKAEWVWSRVGTVTYDPDTTLADGVVGGGFGPLTFKNNRAGGYAQIAYRPSKLETPFLKDMEPVVRFDMLDLPSGAPMGADEDRWTLGLNYWLNPTTVFKAAYQFGERRPPGGSKASVDAFLIQAAMGF